MNLPALITRINQARRRRKPRVIIIINGKPVTG